MEQLNWVTPSVCGAGNNCPEVAITTDAVFVRSNLTPDAPAARLTHQEWRDLVDGISKGEFNV
ncbi:hypothetical protein GCM10010495_36230 [Kitasatospora herbaricolor]|uniref:DUF397 domain-containing protein n=1 Tax=Kitasatospora herbaricolor TaxID=68217 RepID=UPI00174B7540|nr:DUF397 domain-containing protein [Kitasatospora herbaricolor]MDQ0310163.1 hypothetical protein [Kitasatospora herbaricolor]GGV18160.1 hypothetical protein GCM10010495_36230 [Kitasatospora herbaricolor]